MINHPTGAGPIPSNPDSLQNRLQQASATLEHCEMVLEQIQIKLQGPVPPNQAKPEKPNSISTWSLHLNNQAQQIDHALEEIREAL